MAKKEHVKQWLEIYGNVSVNSKGPGKKDLRTERAKDLFRSNA